MLLIFFLLNFRSRDALTHCQWSYRCQAKRISDCFIWCSHDVHACRTSIGNRHNIDWHGIALFCPCAESLEPAECEAQLNRIQLLRSPCILSSVCTSLFHHDLFRIWFGGELCHPTNPCSENEWFIFCFT